MTPLDGAPYDWLGHDFTCRLRQHYEQQAQAAFQTLLAACRKSNDPDVARRYAEYSQLATFVAQLGKEHASNGSDDGDD